MATTQIEDILASPYPIGSVAPSTGKFTTLEATGTLTVSGSVSNAVNDAATNAVTDVLTLAHNTSGTPAANIGTGLILAAETSTTISTTMARIRAIFTDVTHASRNGRLVLSAWDTAERDGIAIEASGAAAMLGFFGASPVVKTSATGDLKDTLVAYGLVTDGGATPLNLDSGALTAGTGTFVQTLTVNASGASPGTLVLAGGASGDEGGQIDLQGAAGYDTYSFDRYQNNIRLFRADATAGASVFEISNAGAGGAVGLYVEGTLEIDGAAQFDGALTANSTVGIVGALTFNDAGADVDARFEGDTDQNLLYLDASADAVIVGAATSASAMKLHVAGGLGLKTHAAFTGSSWISQTAAVQTTNNSVTDIATISVAEGETVIVTAFVVGNNSGTEGYWGRHVQGFRRAAAGNVTAIGAVSSNAAEDSSGAPSSTMAADTTAQTVDIRVTGETAKTWNFVCSYSYMKAISNS